MKSFILTIFLVLFQTAVVSVHGGFSTLTSLLTTSSLEGNGGPSTVVIKDGSILTKESSESTISQLAKTSYLNTDPVSTITIGSVSMTTVVMVSTTTQFLTFTETIHHKAETTESWRIAITTKCNVLSSTTSLTTLYYTTSNAAENPRGHLSGNSIRSLIGTAATLFAIACLAF